MQNAAHPTNGYGNDLARQIKSTVPGMAHWAGSGPADTYCSECKFFGYWKNSATPRADYRFQIPIGMWKISRFDRPARSDLDGNPNACRHFEPRGAAGAR